MVVVELPKIGRSVEFSIAVGIFGIVGRRVTGVLVLKPKMHNLIFDLIDAPISNTMWRAIHNALI
jgi:hypothetical protein